MSLEEVSIDLGPLGSCQLEMLEHFSFLSKCTDTSNDSTGLRVYVGSNVFVRFLHAYASVIFAGDVERDGIELGGGVGLNTVALNRCNINFRSLICTDGNSRAVEIAKKNISIKTETSSGTMMSCAELLWNELEVENFMAERDRFQVVYGSELFYYQTDVESLIRTVLRLADKEQGMFISTHIFRVDGQEELVIDSLRRIGGWEAYVVPIDAFVSNHELEGQPGWYNCRTLVCGSPALLENLISRGGKQTESWRAYSDVLKEESVEREYENSSTSFFMNLSNV